MLSTLRSPKLPVVGVASVAYSRTFFCCSEDIIWSNRKRSIQL